MIYVDLEFPSCETALGLRVDPMWSTTVAVSAGGHEITNQNWEDVRHSFDGSMVGATAPEHEAVRNHWMVMRGRTKKFPVKDPIDFEATQSEGRMVEADTSPANEFQMYKRYGTGSDAYDRKITRPKSGTIAVFRTRAAVTTNVTGSATITYTTGEVSMAGHLAGDTYAWSGEFRVPCRYDIDKFPRAVFERVDDELFIDCGPIVLVEVRE